MNQLAQRRAHTPGFPGHSEPLVSGRSRTMMGAIDIIGFDAADLTNFKKPWPYALGAGVLALLGGAVYLDFFKKKRRS